MKRTKYTTINGVNFEVQKPIEHVPHVSSKRLEDCYNRPSDTKKAIWSEWFDWFANAPEIDYFNIGVRSYNCNFFTIEAYAVIEDLEYYIEITPTHNRLYLIME